MQKRVKDLQNAALEATGKNIDFTFDLSADTAPPAKAAAPAPKKAQPVKAEAISAEEPFVNEDFSAALPPQAQAKPSVSAAHEIGETAKKVLNIFDGHVAEAI